MALMPMSLYRGAHAVAALILSAFVLLALDTPPAHSFGENVSTFTLDNGLEVVVVPDHRAPVVTHMLWYKVGAADEPPGKSGIAHFVEHLMFKGTEDHPEGEFSQIIAERGGQENAFTGSDYTGYFQRVAREHLGLMMEHEADRMTNLTLREEQVESELQVVLEERASRVDNDPSSLLSEAMTATLYQSHPYRLPVIGWRHEIETLTREDALDFYEQHYAPNNAVLVVAGDVTEEEVRELAQATYGQIERRDDITARQRPREPEPVSPRTVTLESPRVDQESVRRVWLVPSYSTAEPGEAEALDVLSEIIGGGATGRLYRELTIEEGIATSVGGWYQGTSLDDTRFMVSATPQSDVSLEELAEGFDRVIADIAAEGPTEDELERARNSLIASTVYSQDSQTTLARIYGAALTTGSTVADVNAWQDRIRGVTADDVAAVAERYLVPERSVTGFLRGATPDRSATTIDPS